MIGEILNAVATVIGYTVLSVLGIATVSGMLMKRRSREVSDEAREMAKAVDPNNGMTEDATALLADDLLAGIRELGADEAVKPDPEPLCHFDWSIPSDRARQEHIEHVIRALESAGYHVQPLPKYEHRHDKHRWDRQRGGVWLSEPDWEIVTYDDETARREDSEPIDLPLPNEWEPEVQ